jgi:hypothetical protein
MEIACQQAMLFILTLNSSASNLKSFIVQCNDDLVFPKAKSQITNQQLELQIEPKFF